MQSSAAVAGRALIMLACVVGIPALALSGTSWSEMLKKLQDFHWPAILNPASASSSASLNDAPRFTSAMPVAAALPGQPAAPMPSTVVPAGYQTPAGSDASLPPAVNVAGPITTTEAPAPSDPFRSIPDRLRQLGATYYLLESWGSEPQMYRFYCKMAMGGNADYTRYFEAADADPLQAMVQVLQQVETWRGGSRNEEVGTRN